MLGGADNPNGELLSYIIGADINPASGHITAGITQSSAGKHQAAAVVKIMFNGNLFCSSV